MHAWFKAVRGQRSGVSSLLPAGHGLPAAHRGLAATERRPLSPAPGARAFTLIEIMIVVAIMGIVMTMSVPMVYKVWRKAPLIQAQRDIVAVCSHARARAIISGKMTEVVFHPKENRLEVAGAGSAPSAGSDEGGSSPAGASALAGSGLSAQLSRDVIIETMDINMSGVEYNDMDEARVRFYPNGIADEMRMILFDGKDRVGIETEVTTGLVDIVPHPLQEWARR